MGKKSHTKGQSFERAVAKKLADWSGEPVHRVPQSGGGGGRWGGDNRMVGDIAFPIESKNNLVFECKKHEDWTLDHLFLNIGKPIKWWEQVVNDTLGMNTDRDVAPCLIFSRNRAETYVLLPYHEIVYEGVKNNGHQVAQLYVNFKNIREEVQEFNTMLFTLDGLTSVTAFDLWAYMGDSDFRQHLEEKRELENDE